MLRQAPQARIFTPLVPSPSNGCYGANLVEDIFPGSSVYAALERDAANDTTPTPAVESLDPVVLRKLPD